MLVSQTLPPEEARGSSWYEPGGFYSFEMTPTEDLKNVKLRKERRYSRKAYHSRVAGFLFK
jgi:hypothetical protein